MIEEKVYVGGNPNQFCASKDKNFVVRYTTPLFVYYKDSESSDTENWPEEKRRELIEETILRTDITPEKKDSIAHCILCVKWFPINNAPRYCSNCQFNRIL